MVQLVTDFVDRFVEQVPWSIICRSLSFFGMKMDSLRLHADNSAGRRRSSADTRIGPMFEERNILLAHGWLPERAVAAYAGTAHRCHIA
jgi:hypothetical protein